MALKLYYDLLSQPSRAVYITLKYSDVNFEKHPLSIREGEHLSDEYLAVSSFHKVPTISDNGFILTESIAILRYLAKTNRISKNIYPEDPKKQARIDEYLEWQHNNTRTHCVQFFWKSWIIPKMMGKPTTPEQIAPFKKAMERSLESLETVWLSRSLFIGGEQLTVADIWAACELEQTRIAGYDPGNGRPKIAAWWNRVRQELNQIYSEAHAIVNELIENEEKSKL